MARKPDAVNPERASNGSQFYIALRDLPFLDGQYTVFGSVVSGWSTIEALVKLAERRDIARVGNEANPGRLALIRSARLTDRAPVSSAQGKAARDTTAGGVPADSTSH
jgi:cyclophilin family peptidyl-prolyl cis-trans isomerase